jgi:hypothetical protein
MWLTKNHTMKTYWRSGGINPRTRFTWVISFTSQTFWSREKGPRYPFDRRLSGPKTGPDAVAKRKKFLPCLFQEMNPDRPASSLIVLTAILTHKVRTTCSMLPDCTVLNLTKSTWRTPEWLHTYMISTLPFKSIINRDTDTNWYLSSEY